jgi:hypothetical protein
MKLVRALLCLALLSTSPAFAARSSVPMAELDNLPINSASGKPPGSEQIRKAIVQGAARSHFSASVQPGNKVRLTYSKRDHSLVMDVSFTPKTYSIKYVDSTNLGYGMEGGKPVIHPRANGWLNKLRQSIDRQLSQI